MQIKKMPCWSFRLLNSYIVMFVLVMSRRTIDSTPRDGSLKITHIQWNASCCIFGRWNVFVFLIRRSKYSWQIHLSQAWRRQNHRSREGKAARSNYQLWWNHSCPYPCLGTECWCLIHRQCLTRSQDCSPTMCLRICRAWQFVQGKLLMLRGQYGDDDTMPSKRLYIQYM